MKFQKSFIFYVNFAFLDFWFINIFFLSFCLYVKLFFIIIELASFFKFYIYRFVSIIFKNFLKFLFFFRNNFRFTILPFIVLYFFENLPVSPNRRFFILRSMNFHFHLILYPLPLNSLHFPLSSQFLLLPFLPI